MVLDNIYREDQRFRDDYRFDILVFLSFVVRMHVYELMRCHLNSKLKQKILCDQKPICDYLRTFCRVVLVKSMSYSNLQTVRFEFFFFFLNFFCRTHSHVIFWGHWYPCFGFLVTSPLGFKARVGSALFTLRRRM